jgi:hypothetical protein
MRILTLAAAALLLSVSFGLQAQAGKALDCSKSANPAACEEREQLRKERADRLRDMHRRSAEVCKTRPSPEQRECMQTEMCREARDPARCEENARRNAERRDKVLEACKGKQGKVLQQCLREEYKKLGPAPKS